MLFRREPIKIFYGWWIVVASFLTATYVGGAVFYGFTAFFEPIINEMGWSYTQVSIAASLRGLEIGLLSPFVGVLVDRWGPRKLIFSGVLIIAASLILLSFTTSLIMFYGAFALMTIGVSACTVIVLLTAVANWFRRKMGIASGIAVAGFGFGGVLVPVIVKLIDMYDWRQTLIILALGMIVMILPLSFLFRHKPEQYGYFPDGQKQNTVAPLDDSEPSRVTEVELRVKQALRNGTFWRLVLARMYLIITMMAIITHVMPYLSSIGIARAMSGLVATAIPLLSVSGRFGLGWLGDKFSKWRKQLAAGALILLTLSLLCFEFTARGWVWLLVPFLPLFGFSYGGNVTMVGVLLREYFGLGNFGTIIGFMWGILMLGTVAGPPIAGWVFDTWGSYQGVWLAFAGIIFVGAVILLMIPPVSTTSRAKDGTS